jgi:hypothetical protein
MSNILHGDLNKLTLENNNYRKVISTTKKQQLVLMSLGIKEEIGMEIHKTIDQFIRIEKGTAMAIIGRDKDIKKYKLNKVSINQYFKTQALKIDLLDKYSYIIWIDNTFKINNNNFINDVINILESHQNNNLFIIDNEYIINENKIKELDTKLKNLINDLNDKDKRITTLNKKISR